MFQDLNSKQLIFRSNIFKYNYNVRIENITRHFVTKSQVIVLSLLSVQYSTVTGPCLRARLHHHGHHQARTRGGGHRRVGRVSGREDDPSEGVRYLDGERQRQDP